MASRRLTEEERNRAQKFARFTYAGVMLAFITICAIAVITTMNIEKQNKGFKAIRVSKPISFIDTTYMDPNTGRRVEKPSPDAQSAQPKAQP